MESRLPAAAVALALIVALLAPGATRAHASPIEDAAEAFRRGLAHYQAGNYGDALVEFQDSYELDPRPAALFAWAQAARLAGHCATAVALYDEFLELEPRSIDAQAARDARELCTGTWPEPEPDLDRELEADPELALEPEPPPRSPRREPAAVVRSAAAPTPARARLLAFARIDIDAAGRGAVVAPGIDVATASGWDAFASALIGGNGGAEIGARFSGGDGRLRPFVAAALPVFFADGIHPGLRASLGVRAAVGHDVAATFEIGGAHALSAPDGASRSVALISLGVELGL